MTIEPHAVAFRFGSAVTRQPRTKHPVEIALAAGKITLSAAVTQAPYLDWPAEALEPWQGTIAAIMQKTAKDEGHVKAMPPTPQAGQSIAQVGREAKIALVMETIAQAPWAFVGDIAKPCNIPISSCFDYLRELEAIGKIQTAMTREGKRYALAGRPPFTRSAIKRDDIEARLLAVLAEKPGLPTYRVTEAVRANKRTVSATLTKLLEQGSVIAERGPGKGSRWSLCEGAAQ